MIDGGADSDVLKLSTGSADTFSTDNKLMNVETLQAHASGSQVVLTGQTEAFTITGGASADSITGGSAVSYTHLTLPTNREV